jgi:hypothetical protein
MLGFVHKAEEHSPFALPCGNNPSLLAVDPLALGTRIECLALLPTVVRQSDQYVFRYRRICIFRLGKKWWMPATALLTVGVSLGLPLLLYLREGGKQPSGPGDQRGNSRHHL